LHFFCISTLDHITLNLSNWQQYVINKILKRCSNKFNFISTIIDFTECLVSTSEEIEDKKKYHIQNNLFFLYFKLDEILHSLLIINILLIKRRESVQLKSQENIGQAMNCFVTIKYSEEYRSLFLVKVLKWLLIRMLLDNI
jgi:hypothetical protein